MTGQKNYGAPWRKKIKAWLKAYKQKCYDPCVEEAGDAEPNWELINQHSQEIIVHKDLSQIRYSTKYIICYFTKYSTGTISELTFAFHFGIPVYFVTKKKRLRGWPGTVSRCKTSKIFRTFRGLKQWLKRNKI